MKIALCCIALSMTLSAFGNVRENIKQRDGDLLTTTQTTLSSSATRVKKAIRK